MAIGTFVHRDEPKNKRRGILIGALIELVIIVLLLLPLLTYPVPPPGQEGILINFGQPDQGGGEPTEEPVNTQTAEVMPEEVPEEQPKPPAKQPKTEKAPEKKVLTTEEPEPSPVKPKQEPKPEVTEAPVDTKKDARDKASKTVPTFKKSSGGTQPDNKPGPEGSEDGEPNNQTKIPGKGQNGTGSGALGGGLAGRATTASPTITDSFQEAGTVVIKVCVDAAGNVKDKGENAPKYIMHGSTTSSSNLIKLAETNAKKWKFGPGEDGQCGTITYTFRITAG